LPTLDFVDLGAGDFGEDLYIIPLLANPVRAGQDRLSKFGQVDFDDRGVLGVGVGEAFGDHPLHQW